MCNQCNALELATDLAESVDADTTTVHAILEWMDENSLLGSRGKRIKDMFWRKYIWTDGRSLEDLCDDTGVEYPPWEEPSQSPYTSRREPDGMVFGGAEMPSGVVDFQVEINRR